MFLCLVLLSLMAPGMDSPTGFLDGERLVAHAMGGIDGRTLTNSEDAFTANYAKGFRWFEVDLRLTSDGGVAAVHDWERYFRDTLGRGIAEAHRAMPVSREAFRSSPVGGKYRPLDAGGIVGLLERHPDVRLVLDMKDPGPEARARALRQLAAEADASPFPGVPERIVPQIPDPETYRMFESIRPFPSYILTLYASKAANEEVLRFVRQAPKIRAVAMPAFRVSPQFVSELKRSGTRVYVHTVNDPKKAAELRETGVDGIYTDFLAPGAGG